MAADGSRARHAAVRQAMRDRRRALSGQDRDRASRAAAAMAGALKHRPAERVGVYDPSDGEISPRPLVAVWRAAGAALAYPRVDGQNLVFAEAAENQLVESKWGICEPPPGAPTVPLASLAILIVPIVAFDSCRNRLGRGAGFYDRALGSLTPTDRPLLVGLAYDFQEIDSIEVEAHDVGMDVIITPDRVLGDPNSGPMFTNAAPRC